MPPSLSLLDSALFESSPDCVKLLDIEGRLLAMNRNGLCAMELDDFAPLAGASWKSLWPAHAGATIEAALERARGGKSASFTAFCPTAKGTPKWWDVTVTPINGLEGGASRLLSVSRDVTASHRALAELYASEARFRSLATATAAIVWNGPASGQFETEQPGWREFTGQSFDQYKGWGWLDAVHPDDRAHTAAAWRETLRTGGLFEVQHRLRRADGVYRHMSVRAVPVCDAQGALYEWVGAHTDISAAVEASGEREALLRQIQVANERMADVFHQAPAFMCVLTGPDHVFEMVNERYRAVTGGRELLGKPARAALPEVEGQGFFELLDQVYRTGETYVGIDMPISLGPQDGAPGAQAPTHYVDFVYMALRDADGNVTGIMAHGVDQTDRVRATEDLRASEERYRTLFKSIDQGFCIIEMLFDEGGRPADYRFLEMNPVFERHTGLANVSGRTALEVVPGLDRFWIDTYGQVALSGQPVRFEHGDAAMGRWFDVYATRMGGDGSARVALLFSDISERKRADEHLRTLAADLALSDRRKTEFLATLAHELRNPLAPIRSGLALLRMGADPARAARIHEVMDRQVSGMVRLIDDLLDIARISGGKLELKKERVELQRVLANAVDTSLPLIEAGGHAFEVDLTEAPLEMEIDPTRIGQVVANLLNNAAKYTPAGGRIQLAVRREADAVRIEVADSGIGIPAESLDTVFDMFNQVGQHTERSHGGLGIGLSLVRRLVELHGGSVVAASAGRGAGSTFTVRLPLPRSEGAGPDQGAGAQPAAPAQASGQAAGLKILVVDDNVDAASTLGMLFEAGGHAVRTAYDGFQGVEQARAFGPDVTFLDIGMPGMDGYDTAQALRRDPGLAGMVLVALTGWGTDSDRLKSKAAGFDLHLTKPVDMAAVGAILAGVGKRSPQRGGGPATMDR